MKELSIERMEEVKGGGCPWWTGAFVGTPYYLSAVIVGGGPPGWILGGAGLIASGIVGYACYDW